METFSALLALCVGNSLVNGEFPSQRPVMRSFDAPLICALNKRLSKQLEAGDLRCHGAYYYIIVMVRSTHIYTNSYDISYHGNPLKN